MIKVNYFEVKQAKNKQNVRKRTVCEFILKKVKETKSSITSDVMPKVAAVEPSPWAETICLLEAENGRK